MEENKNNEHSELITFTHVSGMFKNWAIDYDRSRAY